ncbi:MULTISPECIES: type II toxin-antitoxin system RelE/ParE family toxin [unclassified Desulfovibrio]|uniref:type II toxin-antitoxin system RelE/ParE family toxin n=1 Tax=unclassified Desulfovibrio TaxID=2593640 RepID=UPI000F5F5A17|nr:MULTISPECIES: type II toxin-antitoxin system RelE/ParE family toxin [unclassified Desulfovibrio]RRD69765.1 type II toxin-antitoxin system RelE/ParE family toxin [Desulfovibrio sp. OH1209_COT-279]RRD86390.1 type II toxin-antitoxin system RelE/ParE family toxin [Desulfovibrio sp. OH1186_COT-070]
MSDDALREAVQQIESGNFDADLGGGVFKQRIARAGGGQSGGYRVVLCFRAGMRTFFVYGYAKSARANLGADEVRAFKKLAKALLAMTEEGLEAVLGSGVVEEVPRKGE